MKILIIGYTGFIGQYLSKRLIENNHRIIGLDIKPPDNEQKKSCEYITGDILDADNVSKALNGVDTAVVLAAKHHDFGVTKAEFFKVNETGTKIILDCASKANVKNIIFYSTVAVYGSQKRPTNENTVPTPDTNYGKSKFAAEKILEQWVDKDNTRQVVILRPTVVFGPGNYANVYNLIDKIYKKRFLFVGRGDNIKSVAYVENLVDVNIFLIDKLKPGIQIFNYSDEPQMTIAQTVETITNYLPYGIPKVKIPLEFAVAIGSSLDLLAKLTRYNIPITAARMKKFATPTHHRANKIRELGFRQRIEIKEGLRKMVQWYLERKRKK